MHKDLERILYKVLEGKRLDVNDGVALLKNKDYLSIGKAAQIICKRKHPENIVTFVIDRNINYTNICETKCKFCAFWKDKEHKDAYVISRNTLFQKIKETIENGGTQLLIQGGINPDLGLEYYMKMLQDIKNNFDIHIHSFSPPEIIHMVNKSRLSIKEVIYRLKSAGLDSIPGGGAEILDNRVRKYISPQKISWELWMEVMTTAHSLGMNTTATMMFGSIETYEERIMHMLRVRDAQDKTGGFTAFIPWSFQPGNTELGGIAASGVDYLKNLAVSRLMLDNMPNLQASWVTQGAKIAQIALEFGANDFGGTMMEENVVKAAGVNIRVPMKEIINCIKVADKIPAQRNTKYDILRFFNEE